MRTQLRLSIVLGLLAALSEGLRKPSLGRRGRLPVGEAAAEVIADADRLYEEGRSQELFDLLDGAAELEPQVLWRRARAHHDLAQKLDDAAVREKLIREGLELAEKAVAEAGEDQEALGYGHKWVGILLGRLGEYTPTKEKMANSFRIKEALEEAEQKLPEDPSVKEALGEWCFKVAGISFVERNVAKMLFGTPPRSSYEEALAFYTGCFELRPSKKMADKIANTYDKMGQKDAASKWRDRAVSL